jgi:oxygen-independent coproporphyrinogen-3 oxidase
VPGIYISYPFCTQKCSFCNFASGVSSSDVRQQYEQLLLLDVRARPWRFLPETVYFGGGTPSLMPPSLLEDLMNAIPRERINEVTLECAPGTVNEAQAAHWASCGINRVSLGVQSFVTTELARTGRRHTAETVQHDMEVLRLAGIHNLNLDLIAGLPGQTRDSWAESLAWLERLQPPHVSIYIFEIDEDSRLGKEIMTNGRRYGASDLPSDDLTAEFYETGVEYLARTGLVRYEISNFAQPGLESAHNLKYWQLEPYVGFGLDAHSFDGSARWSTPDTLLAFMSDRDGSAERKTPECTLSDPIEEHFFVGLRLMAGIEPGPAEWARFAEPIRNGILNGMLIRDGSRLRLSDRGVLISNEILQEFVTLPEITNV